MRGIRFAAALAVFAAGSAAEAVTNSVSGGRTLQVLARTSDDRIRTRARAFVMIPQSGVTVSVPGGTSRLVTATFTAESRCQYVPPTLDNVELCIVRPVAQNASTGVLAPLYPDAGTDAAFDTQALDTEDYWETHSVQRLRRLPAGQWLIYMQWMVNGPDTEFWVDDWTFRVEVSE